MVALSPRVKDCTPKVSTTTICQPGADFVSDIDFLKLVVEQKTLSITFSGAVLGSSRLLEAICSVSITDDLLSTLAENNWYAARCAAAS